MALSYIKHERISLKEHPEFNEAWLQKKIAEDSTILGLGELVVLERERRQERAGRLDLLLADPDENRRYEVELQLGSTDETHIIRCIEYWDIERRRYPQYDHCAVLVAEDITSRFLNVLALFNGAIPMIAIQLNALQVGEGIVLDFVKVMDRFALRRDDEQEAQAAPANRSYWDNRADPSTVKIADECLAIVNEKASKQAQLNYNRYYIGLQTGNRSTNFVHFRPKKKFTHLLASLDVPEPWAVKCEEEGLDAAVEGSRVRVTLSPGDLTTHKPLLTGLLHQAVADFES